MPSQSLHSGDDLDVVAGFLDAPTANSAALVGKTHATAGSSAALRIESKNTAAAMIDGTGAGDLINLKNAAGTSRFKIDNAGAVTGIGAVAPASLAVTGAATVGTTLGVTGATRLANNLTVGAAATLGDNGVGEIQLAAAATPPTTNPVGGVSIYCVNDGVFLRDSTGDTYSLVDATPISGTVTGSLAETISYTQATVATATTSGVLVIASVFLPGGVSVGHIGFVNGATAATNPTHWWVVLLDNTYKQQAHSADQLTAAIAANTWYPLAMVTPAVTAYSGRYYLGVMITTAAGVQPTLAGPAASPLAAMVTGTGAPTPLFGGTSTAALTVPGTDGATVYAAPNGVVPVPYLYAAA